MLYIVIITGSAIITIIIINKNINNNDNDNNNNNINNSKLITRLCASSGSHSSITTGVTGKSHSISYP